MSSERRIQASRANGARSRGPVTTQGKINSSKNSTRHGILAQTIVLDSESKSRFEDLLNAYKGEFQPRTPAETTMVETLASARWRQLRVCHIQRASFDLEMARSQAAVSSNPVRAATVFRELSDNSHCLDLMLRYETAFDRQFTRALNALLKLQSRPGRGDGPDLPPQTSTAATWDPDDPSDENQGEPLDLPNEPTNLLKTGEPRGTTDSTPAEIHPGEPSLTIRGSTAPQRTAPGAGPKRSPVSDNRAAQGCVVHWVTGEPAVMAPSPSILLAPARNFAAKHKIRNVFDSGCGSVHHVLIESGLWAPGKVIIGCDSHTPITGRSELSPRESETIPRRLWVLLAALLGSASPRLFKSFSTERRNPASPLATYRNTWWDI